MLREIFHLGSSWLCVEFLCCSFKVRRGILRYRWSLCIIMNNNHNNHNYEVYVHSLFWKSVKLILKYHLEQKLIKTILWFLWEKETFRCACSFYYLCIYLSSKHNAVCLLFRLMMKETFSDTHYFICHCIFTQRIVK